MTTVDTTPPTATADTAATATATLREAITAFKAGEQVRAQMLLQQTLDLDPQNQSAWVWLAAVTSDPARQREYLEHAGNIDPFSEPGLRAQEMLARLEPAPAVPAARAMKIPKLRSGLNASVKSHNAKYRTEWRPSCADRIAGVVMSLLFGLIGIAFAGSFFLHNKELNTLSSVPSVTGVVLSEMPPGRQVFVEGHISARNEIRSDFVAYEYQEVGRKRVRDEDGDYRWEETWFTQSRYVPALRIDTASGTVRVEEGYSLTDAPHTQTKGDERRIGFQVGDAVVVLGTARQAHAGEAAMSADMLRLGTKASYIRSEHKLTRFFFEVGTCIITLAVVMAGSSLGIIPALRRRLRAVRS
jgi:hypothetical protein